MKKILILINLLASTICSAQTQYSGVDTSTNHSAKVTLSNLALYSEQFDNAAWTKLTLTGVTANDIVAPDGATTAEKVTLSATTSSGRYIYGTAVVSVGNMSARREAVFLKKGTHNFVQLYSQYPNTAYIDVDLNSGTILRSGATNITTFMISVGNGWYYVGFTHTPTSNSALPTITPLKDAVTVAGTSWTSAGTETFYIWGSQVNLASAPRDYLLTTSAAVTLAGVCPSGTSQSLLDPSKCFPLSSFVTEFEPTPFTNQNLALYSETLENVNWNKVRSSATANTVVAPDGTTTGDSLIEDATASNTHYVAQAYSILNSTAYRYSFYAKAGTRNWVGVQLGGTTASDYTYWDLSTCTAGTIAANATTTIQSLPNGWCRITLTATSNSTTAVSYLVLATADNSHIYTGDGASLIYLWGQQIQLASSSPNYVPTTTAAVTTSGSCPIGYEQNYRNPSKCNRSNTVTAPANYINAAAIASGAITSAKFASGAVDAAAIATDAIGGAELATDTSTEIREAILTRQLEDNYSAGTLGSYINEIKKYVANKFIRTGNTYEIKKDNGSTTFATGTSTGGNRTPD